MQTEPGELIASRIAVLPDGGVAEVIVSERTGAYATRIREAHARWFGDGAWSAWRFVAEGAEDASIAADASQQEPSALISVIVWVFAPTGAIAAHHVARHAEYFRLTANGLTAAAL